MSNDLSIDEADAQVTAMIGGVIGGLFFAGAIVGMDRHWNMCIVWAFVIMAIISVAISLVMACRKIK